MRTEDVVAARAVLANVAAAIEAGELTATDLQLAHLRGALTALDALGGGSDPSGTSGEPEGA